MTTRALDLVDLSLQFHNDRKVNWQNVMDLAAACPWGTVDDPASREDAQAGLKKLFGNEWFMAHAIATVEHGVGKQLSDMAAFKDMTAALDVIEKTERPALLHAFWRRSWLTAENLRQILLDSWRYTDFPCGPWCPPSAWVRMFRTAGFFSDGTPRPKRPITVYCGSTPHRPRGMSWSTEQWVAEKFADYWYDQGQAQKPGHVYKSKIHPRHILAIMPEKKASLPKIEVQSNGSLKHSTTEFMEVAIRPEFEVIVDPKGLQEIVLIETAKVRRARLASEADA